MVKLPFSDTHLTLVVVKGYGKNPLMLLTNVEEVGLHEIPKPH